MNEWIDFEKIVEILSTFSSTIISRLSEPQIWFQLLVVITIFFISSRIIAPRIDHYLNEIAKKSARIPSFIKVIIALKSVTTPFVWLFLQWLVIGIASSAAWPVQLLNTIASLVTAWLVIRLFTSAIHNQSIARMIAITAWSVAALNIFGLLGEAISILDSWSVVFGTIRISPLTVIKTIIALWFSLWLASGLASLVERRLQLSKTVDPSMSVLAGKLTRITLITLAILIAMTSVGIDLTALAVFGGALGVGLGFGLQKIFSNLISGVILLMDRSIKPGDVIAVNQTYGWINHLGARYTSVITRDGIEHLIPNEELITQRVENWSFTDSLVRLRLPVGISYNSDVRLAIKLCLEATTEVQRIEQQPAPRCLVTGFGDSSVNLEIRFWIKDPSNGRGSVLSDLLLEIWDRFHQHGIEIPYPQRDLHLQSFLGVKDLEKVRAALQNE